MPPANATHRFSSRVENYVRYRPGYPREIVSTLERECGLSPRAVIADIGSGTGLLAQIFLDQRYTVVGIEPNTEMRETGQAMLARYSRFHSVNGSAEATTLPDKNVDVIVAGQAWHWFDVPAASKEFRRVLKPGGLIVLVWNTRHTKATPFLADYEHLLRTYCEEYDAVDHRTSDPADIGIPLTRADFPNAQVFDFEGVRGRLLSSSYAPEAGLPRHNSMLAELRRIFDLHQVNGEVTFTYTTEVFYGRTEKASGDA